MILSVPTSSACRTVRRSCWPYAREADPSPANDKGKKRSFLVLEVVVEDNLSPLKTAGEQKPEIRRVAQLACNEESRIPGPSSCTLGNGGELRIDAVTMDVANLREDNVIATCLMMLKEIDRRCVVQFMMLAAIVS
jgi:hypothetical protein